jgi:two-component system sensor histidine kinase DegS
VKSIPAFSENRKWIVARHPFWIIVVAMVAITLLHYLTPQIRVLSPTIKALFNRHAVERILFLLVVIGATFAFGRNGGLTTLIAATLIMLPRALWLSPSPGDAILETAATVVVGYLAIWTVQSQTRERALRQRTIAQLRTINAVAGIVTGSLELEQILNDALDNVLEVTGLESGLIFFINQQTRELILAAHRGISEESAAELGQLRLGEGFCGQAAQSGELMVIPDALQNPDLAKLAVRREGLRSQIVVPLESKGKVQGVMAVATRCVRKFASADLELITAIGNQIGVAIENAWLHQDIARQLQVQQQLNAVVEQITSELELDKILPKVLQIAEELAGADGGGIALFDRDRTSIHYPYLHNLPQELAGVFVPRWKGAAGEVVTTGQPIIIEDYQTYPNAIPEFAEEGLTSLVAVPIVSGDSSFGTLTLVTLNRLKHFSDRDVTILTAIGRQAGIAIENARLYENLRFYIHRITEAQEEERRRIARELHDETIQTLVVIARRLEVLATLPERLPAAAIPHLDSLEELIGNTLKSTRRFIHDLRPPILDDLGLLATLEGLISNMRETSNIEIDLRVSGKVRRLIPEEELVLFRIVQETLNNVWRHSGASWVVMHVEFHPGKVRISIEDNGRGFNAPERVGDLVSSGKLGLIGMYERARILGGTLMIRSEAGQGTEIVADVPVHPAPN